jgi:hypothetical protein
VRCPGILRAGNKSSPAKPGPNGPVRRRTASLELVSLSGADPLNSLSRPHRCCPSTSLTVRKNTSKPASVEFINQAVVGEASAPRWLDTDWLLGQFGEERMPAIGAYRQFVLAGKGAPSPLNQVRHQMLLGDDALWSGTNKAKGAILCGKSPRPNGGRWC